MEPDGSRKVGAASGSGEIGRAFRGLRDALGLPLTAFLLLSALFLGGFGLLAARVPTRDVGGLDAALLLMARSAESAWLDDVALEITALGANPVLLILAAAVAAALWVGRYRAEAFTLLAAAGGGILLNQLLKHAFGRPRPELLEAKAHVASPLAFPSSHATAAMATYLVLAYLLARHLEAPAARGAAFGLAGMLVLLTGASRVYLGVHYPSDVLAGWLLGFVWATACLAVGRLASRRAGPGGQGCRANTRVAPPPSKRRTS